MTQDIGYLSINTRKAKQTKSEWNKTKIETFEAKTDVCEMLAVSWRDDEF